MELLGDVLVAFGKFAVVMMMLINASFEAKQRAAGRPSRSSLYGGVPGVGGGCGGVGGGGGC